MSCFMFPKTICDAINAAMGNFWWGSTDRGNKIHWKGWSSLCVPKQEGGLGFKDMHHYNVALLAKQCWCILSQPESLWVKVLKARYFPECDFLHANKGYRASWGWSSILQARDLIMEGSGWQIANGLKVNIWKENWLHPPDVRPIQTTAQISNNGPHLVFEIIDWPSKTWNLDSILHLIQPSEANKILLIPIGSHDGEDRITWPWNKRGVYTVSSGYTWINSRRPISPPAVIQSSLNLALEFWSANRKDPPSLESEVRSRKRWQPPPLDVVDVCCDASWIESGSCGMGVVIRSNSGELVDCVSNVNKCGSSAMAEANALLLGVETALNLGLGKVCLRSDSLEVINNIKASSNYMDWGLFPIIEEIRKRSQSFGSIPREANQAAHVVASLTKSKLGLHRWASMPPPSLASVLRNDGLPCPPAPVIRVI
ncbi:hypothetical protein ACLB2K_013233 [Fragaria x ananassa]